MGLPRWLSGKESAFIVGDVDLIPGSGRSRGKWQPTPLFLPGKSNGQRSRGATVHGVIKDSDTTEQLNNNEHDLLLSNSFEKHLTSVIS